ncbi:site-specific DNA-methyltransferase [Microvirga aerilata]|uniref:site-specific DNA-methyltransferase (adenine-specific) n=1 Tax=Microvirga aerilata TaxID=670292 RepID=A0A936ZES7_9HYPH|nr:site-specific DNA-methyltransferase [Microvirga aerilata]MBL0404465.1 site-specific DNA-methyltransferase [Microvirga aerilata]
MNKPEPAMPEKVDLRSMDVVAGKRDVLKSVLEQYFPEALTEGNVDFNQLKRALGDWIDPDKERFGLTWPGKAECMRIIQQPSVATLKPERIESVDFDSTENLFIEGDNLEVLKLLQKAYYGKVKMIYIDPPYNTGQEFIYPDKYAESLETYLAYTGQIDSQGKKFATNSDTVGRYHSNWLNMMYPRIYLARNLLSDDGVIFISIDDNEVANLRKLCDEIFGEENLVATFVWKSRQNKDNRPEKGASVDHEYILCYGRRVRGDERNLSQYSNPDDDPRGPWTSANMVGLATKDRRPNLHFDLIDPATGINYGCPAMGWRYDPRTMAHLIAEGRILWPSSADGRPRRKAFLEELTSEFTGVSSIIGSDVYTRDGTAEVNEIFGFRAMDFPKPTGLLRELIEQGASDGCVVLDFFAGSCTTAHALFEHNISKNMKCRFITVQLPEKVDETSEAYRAGYKTIADIGKERIRRVANQLSSVQDGHLDGSTAITDFGFRVFKLHRSNFKVWDGQVSSEADLGNQLELHIDHVLDTSNAEDVLYELLLKAGFPLTTKVQTTEMAGKQVYSVQDGALLICLEKEITPELLDALAEADPLQVICLDEGFKGNDQLKTNAVQTFKARAQAEESEIVFKTV